MGNRIRLLFWAIVALLVVRSGAASAATSAESDMCAKLADTSAERYVCSKHYELIALLAQPKTASRDQKITAVMDRVFDYDDLARRSLAEEWANRSQTERDEFKGLLEQLVRQSYRKHLDKTVGWDVTYGTPTNAEGGRRVPSTAKHKTDKRKEPVGIDYLLHEKKGQWRVFDVVIEGSSLVRNYQSQFRKIIHKKGFKELIDRMKRRLAKGSD